MTTNPTPRIYVACLASYNNGTLHGAWIDCTDVEQMATDITKMLAASPTESAEEYAIHDTDGFGDAATLIGEHTDLATVAQIAEGIAEHGDPWAAYAAHQGDADAASDFEEAYCGQWDTFAEYAADFVDSTGMLSGIDDTVARYFDYDSFANDLEHDYIVCDDGTGGVHVFMAL